MSCIEIKNVSKYYGDKTALKDVSVCFESGKIYGLLGRNGAGKTTLLNSACGKIFPEHGEINMDGSRISENDEALGKIYMLTEQSLYPEKMKVKEAFKWSADFYRGFDTEYCKKAADIFKLNINKKISTLSTGYATIFKLITALSTNAEYLLLDEPVLGLDANHRELFYKSLIEKYSQTPFCAVLSTHLVEEISGFIEDVIIINEGEIIKNESRESLLSEGCTISGNAKKVDEFIAGKNVLGTDSIGGLKSAYILGRNFGELPEGLEKSALDLQKLFVQLTNT